MTDRRRHSCSETASATHDSAQSATDVKLPGCSTGRHSGIETAAAMHANAGYCTDVTAAKQDAPPDASPQSTAAPSPSVARMDFTSMAKREAAAGWISGTDKDGAEARAVRVPFDELKTATGMFESCNSIGEGGSCRVYRGELFDVPVAVKRLEDNDSSWERQQFASESKCSRDHVGLIVSAAAVLVVAVLVVCTVGAAALASLTRLSVYPHRDCSGVLVPYCAPAHLQVVCLLRRRAVQVPGARALHWRRARQQAVRWLRLGRLARPAAAEVGAPRSHRARDRAGAGAPALAAPTSAPQRSESIRFVSSVTLNGDRCVVCSAWCAGAAQHAARARTHAAPVLETTHCELL